MEHFPKRENALRLIDEAVGRAAQLGGPYDNDLMTEFVQAQEALTSSVEEKSQMALILSAARGLINWAEKKTIGLIIGDKPITGQQMTHLVRIRLICTELINLLNNWMESLRPSPGRAGLAAQR